MRPITQPIQHPDPQASNDPGSEKVVVDVSALENKKKEKKRKSEFIQFEQFKRHEEELHEHPREHPIARERHEKIREIRRDDKEMAEDIPLTKRIQRKEEEALGTSHSKKPFVQALLALEEKPETILCKMHTVFPFDFFPSTVTIDPIKIQITDKYFFYSQQTQSVLIKDISKCYVEVGPLNLATLKIITSDEKDRPISIPFLPRDEARKARKIISGLVISRSESPDITKMEAIR